MFRLASSRKGTAGQMPGLRREDGHRTAQPEAHQHVVRRASEPHDGNVDAEIHAADERLQQESRDARALGGAPLHALQFREDPLDAEDDPGSGGWCDSPTLGG